MPVEEQYSGRGATERHGRRFYLWGVLLNLLMTVILGGIVLFVTAFVMLYIGQIRRAEAPYFALRSFVERENVDRDLAEVGDLRVDEMKLFAQAACVQGQDLQMVKKALRVQMRGVPANVVDEIVESALVEGVSTQNTVQNTTTGVEADGKAYSYLAFWSTEFNGDHAVFAATYSTCVMVSGVQIEVGEEVSEWETSVQSRLVAYQPCQCGWLRCAQCPVFKEVTTKRPIMKRHRLTLRNQLDLHRWMVKRAVDQAALLVETRKSIGGSWIQKDTPFALKAPEWEAPRSHVYYGSDGHKSNAIDVEESEL